MSQQPDLFGQAPDTSRPHKAVTVPRTSVEACLETDREGRSVRVLERLRGWGMAGRGWPTSAELAAWMSGESKPSTDAVLFVRRGLSDLLADGLVEHAGERPCAVSTGRGGRALVCKTWKVRTR